MERSLCALQGQRQWPPLQAVSGLWLTTLPLFCPRSTLDGREPLRDSLRQLLLCGQQADHAQQGRLRVQRRAVAIPLPPTDVAQARGSPSPAPPSHEAQEAACKAGGVSSGTVKEFSGPLIPCSVAIGFHWHPGLVTSPAAALPMDQAWLESPS